MFRVSDVPAEVWSLIFEHLNLEDLVDVNSACAPFWGSITRRVARVISLQHYSPFPADSFCVHRLRQSPGKDGAKNGLKQRRSYFRSCKPNLTIRSYSQVFHSSVGTTKLSLQLELPVRHDPRSRTPEEFHSSVNGFEPIEVIWFSAFFTSVQLPHHLGGTLKFSYSTIGMSIFNQLDDVPLDQGCFSRTISHRLSWETLTGNTLGMPTDDFVDLPKEWAEFLHDHIDVMIRFEKNPASTHDHWVAGRETSECTQWVLKDFKATWTFSSVPPSIAQAVSLDSRRR
jgi:hypothetical protein